MISQDFIRGPVPKLVSLFTLLISLALPPDAYGATVGKIAPSFITKNQDGKVIDLQTYIGKNPILLYFYPKDDTPGCTKEACQFRDKFEAFKKTGAVIFGISRQGIQSHKDFTGKYHIPFDLLTDESGAIAKMYGIESYPVVGFLKRESVLIGKNGKILKYYQNVNPETHPAEVLKDLAPSTAKQ